MSKWASRACKVKVVAFGEEAGARVMVKEKGDENDSDAMVAVWV